MRKSISFISVICLLLMAAMPLSAQDARQRKTETMKGYVFVGEKVVCEAEFMAQIVKNK